MKSLFVLPFLFFSILVYSQTKQDTTWKARISKIEAKLSSTDNQNIAAEIAFLKDKLDFQEKISEQTINSISVQLNAASNNLTLFGILLAIAAIGLGFYVTRIERTIVKIGEENKEMLAKSQKIKEDVDAVNKLIQSDIHKLFTQIKREETEYILDRLVKAPYEIRHVHYTLSSRELQPENFLKLRQAYLNFDREASNHWQFYISIFGYHFLVQTLKDKQLRKEMTWFIHIFFRNSLENEIIKCTVDFATVVVDEGIQEFQEEINFFFSGLTEHKYEKCQELTRLLFDNLKTRKNRFDTFNVIESVQDKRFAKIAFGKHLSEFYSNDKPTESELLVFAELNGLILIQQEEDELERQK